MWYMDMTSETTSKCRPKKTINSHKRNVRERRRMHTRIVLKRDDKTYKVQLYSHLLKNIEQHIPVLQLKAFLSPSVWTKRKL